MFRKFLTSPNSLRQDTQDGHVTQQETEIKMVTYMLLCATSEIGNNRLAPAPIMLHI